MVESASRSQASLRQVFEEMLITLYFSYILKSYSSGNCCVTKRHSGIRGLNRHSRYVSPVR